MYESRMCTSGVNYSGLFHYCSLGGDTARPGVLHTRLCHAFLVSDFDSFAETLLNSLHVCTGCLSFLSFYIGNLAEYQPKIFQAEYRLEKIRLAKNQPKIWSAGESQIRGLRGLTWDMDRVDVGLWPKLTSSNLKVRLGVWGSHG